MVNPTWLLTTSGAPAARNVARAGEFPDLGKGRAPVVLDARVGANVRLGDDPAALPAAQRGQAEPHLARSAVDPEVLLATFQEGRFTADGGAVGCGYALSRDGGFSWTTKEATGVVKDVQGSYVLQPNGQRTNVTYELALELTISLPGFLKRQAEKQVIGMALDGLKKRVEGT